MFRRWKSNPGEMAKSFLGSSTGNSPKVCLEVSPKISGCRKFRASSTGSSGQQTVQRSDFGEEYKYPSTYLGLACSWISSLLHYSKKL